MGLLLPVILSGGAGARLWPVSREAVPKPFIKLPDGESLLFKTLKRAVACAAGGPIVTLTNRDYLSLTRDEYGAVADEAEFLLEPVARNTAPAICAAALHAQRRHGADTAMLILPADHLIEDKSAFERAVAEARALAERGFLVTFGIAPTRPETGFGYIEAGQPLSGSAAEIKRFVEKPDLASAKDYVASGCYSWNSGMFCFAAGTVLEAMRKHAPEVVRAVEASLAAADTSASSMLLDEAAFAKAPNISFDYAVMEKAGRRAVVRATFDWNDIGSWLSLADLAKVDEGGNAITGETLLVDSNGTYVLNDGGRVVAAVGTRDLIVVDTPDALLVLQKDRAQQVKAVVERLKTMANTTAREHRTLRRQWGSVTILAEGPEFRVKRVTLKPRAAISLQLHHHRSEHWVVVSGAAQITRDGAELLVRARESAYVAAGKEHRITNPGTIDCVMIEVQTGDYVGEDDIVRLEDRY